MITDEAGAGALAPALERLRPWWEECRPELRGVPLVVWPLGRTDGFTATAGAGNAVVVHLAGTTALVGSGCALCLTRRWQAAQSVTVREAIELGGPVHAGGGPVFDRPAVAVALAGLIAAGEAAAGSGGERVYRLDLHTLLVESVLLLPDPACPACGSVKPGPGDTGPGEIGPGKIGAGDTEPAGADLSASPKYAPERSFRSRPLDSYTLPEQALVNPVCGLLGRGVVPELDLPTTSAIWGCFSTRTSDDLYEIYWAGHADSFARSLRVGLLEGLERHSGMTPRPGAITAVASLGELRERSVAAVDPRECGLYSEEFYADAEDVVPFTPELVIPWVAGRSLRDPRRVLVPGIVAYYHSSAPAQRFVQECSNGCASGSTLAEAAYCGLMELIERDAFLLTWYGRAPLTEIDATASTRTATRALIDRMALHGYRARFFDARITFDIPVVIGVAERLDGDLGALCVGAGAGLETEDALAAALAEIATDSMNHRRRTERNAASLREMARDFTKVLRIHDHSSLFGLPEMAGHADFLLRRPGPTGGRGSGTGSGSGSGEGTGGGGSLAPLPPDSGLGRSDDLAVDLARCVDHLAERGFDVVVVDQTSPEQAAIGQRTAGVIVPGLLPLDFGWHRQRALHMPRMRSALREAGLAGHDLDYDDLHLVPHPFP